MHSTGLEHKTFEGDHMSIGRRGFLATLGAAGAAAVAASRNAFAQEGGQRLPKVVTAGPVLKYSKPVIDAHFHWRPDEFYDLIKAEGAANGMWDVQTTPDGGWSAALPGYHPYTGGRFSVPPKAKWNREWGQMATPENMIKVMKERRVDMYTVTQTNPHVVWANPEFGAKLARVINDGTAKLCADYPKHFTAAITLPMQDVKLALAELERARKLPGMRAVNITENIGGRNIGHKDFWPVYEQCEKLNMAIFLHNVDPLWERFMENDYTMINVLGNPFEATTAATSLVLSGAMDEFPKLDVYFPHAGGFFPFLTPRMDWSMGTAEYRERGRTKAFANLKQRRASDYRRRFHYDLIMHDPKITRMLIDLVGADRVACGTDFAQGMGVMRPVEYVEAIPNITQRKPS
jgi:aminocarboxymuconate-semialdehyde decarboxylase